MDDYTVSEVTSENDFQEDFCNTFNAKLTTTAPVTDRQLEDQITTLCASIAASEYQFLKLLAEFDTRRAWGFLGTRTCAHWLNWRCGMNMGAAREKVRVAHALTNLPEISEAFSNGHLSYSKVRAMTRIATPEIEQELLLTAQNGSASHIEKLVRIYRRCESMEALKDELNATNQRHYTRELFHFWDDNGNLVIKATLPPEQGAVVLKALEAAADSLKSDDQYHPWQNFSDGVVHGEIEVSKDAVVAEPQDELQERQRCTQQPVQPCVNDVSAEIPVPGTKAPESSERKSARRVDALVLVARDWLGLSNPVSKNADRYQVVVNVDAEVLADRIRPDKSLAQSVQSCALDDMHALPVDTVRRISCDCSVLGVITQDQQPLSISRKTRSIPSAIRRALVRRDHGCTFPGCASTRFVEGHHLTHWANGGETSVENLCLLCSHHHQLVHEGGYSVKRDDAGQLAFHDSQGRYIDPQQAQPDDIEYRYLVHRMQSAGIDEKSLWTYSGGRMDYDQAVEGLISQRNRAFKHSVLDNIGPNDGIEEHLS